MEQLNLRVLAGDGPSPRIKLVIEKDTAINLMKAAQREYEQSHASHLNDRHMSFIELERMEDPRSAYIHYPDVRQPNQDGPDWNYTYHIFSGDPFIDMFLGRDNQGNFFLTNQPLPYGTQDENNFACDFDLFDKNTGAVLIPILKAMAGTFIHYKINEEALIGMPEMTLVTLAPFVQAILQSMANDQSPHQLDSKTGIDLGTIEDGWTFHPYKIENGQVFDPMWGKYVQIATVQADDIFRYGAQTVVHLVTDFTGPNMALTQNAPLVKRDPTQAEGYLLRKHTGDIEADTIEAVVPVPATRFGKYPLPGPRYINPPDRQTSSDIRGDIRGDINMKLDGSESETELRLPTVKPIRGSKTDEADNGALASE